MKLVTLLTILLSSLSSYAYDDIHCRKVDDLTKIIKLKRTTLIAAVDEYEDWESQVSTRKNVLLQDTKISAYGLEFKLETSVQTSLPETNIDGDSSFLFQAQLVKGLKKSYSGEYVCIESGYLALTIQGDEPNGGYSISLNY